MPQGFDPHDLGRFGLEGWTWRLDEAPDLSSPDWAWSDGLGTCSRRVAGGTERLLLRSDGIASALVSIEQRSILVFDVEDEEGHFDHWLTDQVVPRVLSHLGHLVVHGGAVVADGGRAVLVTAPSGHGKSTLTAYLHRRGWPILGDDAALLRPEVWGVAARAVYPRLKLRTDSWRHLHPDSASDLLRPGWKISVDLAAGEAASLPPGTEVPLAAVLCLAPPGEGQGTGEPRLRPVGAAELCIALLRNSFALDPADRAKAARRLSLAGAVANMVPGFLLSYPRDYDMLPAVRELIRDALPAPA